MTKKKSSFVHINEASHGRIIAVICENELQSFARQNLRRKLTEKELKKVSELIREDHVAVDHLYDAMWAAIFWITEPLD